MSELITPDGRADFRWQLLATVSGLALCCAISAANVARAQEEGHPTVWIELGGQLERLQENREPYTAPFTRTYLDAPYNFVPSSVTQRPPRSAFGGEAKILLEPDGSNWVFSAGLRYGRANGKKHVHQQTSTQFKQHITILGKYRSFYRSVTRFNDTDVSHGESHAIIDFSAGKDVGLGMFGHASQAVFSLGIRYAQFHSQSNVTLRSFPDPYYAADSFINVTAHHHHTYYGHSLIYRSFSGVGPSISLDASSPVLGSRDAGEIAIDWGANAALLFGRNKVVGSHEEIGNYFRGSVSGGFLPQSAYDHIAAVARRHSIVVPNIGGFAGLTFRSRAAKVSFGYRADFFFGAMDGGADTKRTSDVGFFGPFATISVGLGG